MKVGSGATMGPIIQAMDGPGVNNFIALTAAVIALLSVIVALGVYIRTERRERRVEKSSAYLNLEVQSSETFRYQAEHALVMATFQLPERPADVPGPDHAGWETTLNFYFQCLNLFEVCSNFRRHAIVSPEVFASWVTWFHEILQDWYFRSIWRDELRANYTRDVRNIFDAGVEIYERESDPAMRERAFFSAVAYLFGGCRVVGEWLDHLETVPVIPSDWRGRQIIGRPGPRYRALATAGTLHAEGRPPVTLDLCWNGREDIPAAAAFASHVIGQGVDYISHGEIQTGLSPDGRSWADNLPALYLADFSDLKDRDLLVARAPDGAIAAVAILAWEETPRMRFAVIEDLVVDPALRSAGVGAQMIAALSGRVQERGVEWVFLESGLRNERAHAFFRRHGFAEVSHVFARRLVDQAGRGGVPGRISGTEPPRGKTPAKAGRARAGRRTPARPDRALSPRP
jgi:ribosomal protein S18 acetylase RimI-like enzyme